MSSSSNGFVRSYTVGLFAVALVAVVLGCMHVLVFPRLLSEAELESTGEILMGPFMGFFYLFVAVASCTVALLRSYRSPAARPATLALSVLWAFWVGPGTAMLVWWAWRIRKPDRVLDSPAA
jgi:hypothetical protein